VGGGGLISGIGLYLKSINPKIEIVACYPSASPVMAECMKAGKIVDYDCKETISEATAGGIEPGAITLQLCLSVVDRDILVEESQIISTMREAEEKLGIRIEGAAGVALAACQLDAEKRKDKIAAVIICGGNISEDKFNKTIKE